MEYFFALIVFVISIAVYRDALAKDISQPAKWGVGVSFFVFIVLPLYLFRRNKMSGSALESVESGSKNGAVAGRANPITAYLLMFFFAFIMPFLGFMNGYLPKCDSSEVASLIGKIVNGQHFSDAAQVSYDRFAEVRHCNLKMSDKILSYTVRWYSDAEEEFVVHFER